MARLIANYNITWKITIMRLEECTHHHHHHHKNLYSQGAADLDSFFPT